MFFKRLIGVLNVKRCKMVKYESSNKISSSNTFNECDNSISSKTDNIHDSRTDMSEKKSFVNKLRNLISSNNTNS